MHPFIQTHKKFVMLAAIGGACLVLAGLRWTLTGSRSDGSAAKPAAPSAVPAVQAFQANTVRFVDELVMTGTIQGGARVELRFNRDGRIAAIHRTVGQKVAKGDLIAQMETGEASIRRQQAEAELSQAVDLYRAGAIAKPRLTQARLAAELARKEYARSFLRAPRDGAIGEMNAEVGEVVGPSQTVGTLVAAEKVYVEMGVIERDLGKMSIGQNVQIEVETYPGVTFKGTIARIAPHVEGTSRTRTVRAAIDNADGLLLPGMFARAKIFVAERPDALVVPAAALRQTSTPGGGAAAKVFAIGGDGRLGEKPVVLGYESAEYVEVKDGLEPGTVIVAQARGDLRDGMKVEVIEELAYEPR